MKSTMDALSNITDMLNKPKKKYQFYNTSLNKADLKEIHEKYEIQEEKKLDETKLNINECFDNSVDPEIIVNTECLETSFDQLDQTISADSNGEATFLEDILSEHKKLKQTLIELELSTKQEMEEMKQFYEGQISTYIQILSSEKDKNSQFNLNSTRSNIEGQLS